MVTTEGAWDLKFVRALNESELFEVIQLLQVIGEPSFSLSDDSLLPDNKCRSYG